MRGLISFSEHRLTDKNIIGEYVLRKMLETEQLSDISHLRDFLRHDVKVIYNELLAYDWKSLFSECGCILPDSITLPPVDTGLGGYVQSIEAMLSCESNEALGGAILAHTDSFGTGSSSAFSALKWQNGRLVGILRSDEISFDALTGPEHQKKVLIEIPRALSSESPTNDVLLTGSSGTGKSSCVKACLNMFKNRPSAH